METGQPTPQQPLAERSRLVVLMFTDIVGSTQLKSELTVAGFLPLLKRHDELLRQAVAAGNGLLQQDTGDGCFAIFSTASDAVRAALVFQVLMSSEPWPSDHRLISRVGIHAGEVAETAVKQDGGNKVVGLAADLAARVMSLALGGQILITKSAFNDARQFVSAHPADASFKLQWLTHGPYLFKGGDEPMEISEVGVEGTAPLSPPPDSEKARRALRPGEDQVTGWRPAIGKELPGHPHWIIEKKLGEGGFGEVWLARHAKAKSVRVFKFCFDADRLRSLKREVVLFRLLKEALGDRRDIAAVKDWNFDQPPYFIEMEYTPSGNLTDWAESQGGIDKLPLQQRIAIVAKTAKALSAAHSVGILHKDIKPSNILMVQDADGTFYPRLTDFGIGFLTDRSRLNDFKITAAGFTASNLTMNDSSRTGTRMYTPPEALAEKPHTVQGDVYALGVMLYQMIIADLLRPLGIGWERNVDHELLRQDIAACVDEDANRRLASTDALATRLESLATRKSELEEQVRRTELQRLSKRRRAQVRVLTTTLVVLASVSFVVIFLWRDAAHQKQHAQMAAASEKQQRERAESEATKARRSDYFNRILLIDSRLKENSIAEIHSLLDECSPDLRRWEWGWFKRSSEQSIATFDGHAGPVFSVAFSPDGQRIVSGNADKTVKVWDSHTGKEVLTLRGHEDRVNSVAFSPDGQRVVTGSEDKTIKVWDANSGKELLTLRGYEGCVFAAAFTPDGKRIVSGGSDYMASSSNAKPPPSTLEKRDAKGLNWFLKIWDSESGKELVTHGGPEVAIRKMAVSPDGRWIACNHFNDLDVWDIQSGKTVQILRGHEGSLNSVAFSPDGTQIATGSDDKTVKLWDALTGTEMLTLRGHGDTVTSLAFSANGQRIVSASNDKTLKVWDAQNGREVQTLRGHNWWITSVAFSRDCQRIVSGGWDGTAKVWDAQENKEAPTMGEHEGDVNSVAFTSDGSRILSASNDRTIKVWNTRSGREVLTLRGHDDRICSAVFSPDGRRIVSGSDDKTLRMWDVRSGKELMTLRGHADRINSVAYRPDGQRIVSGSVDKTVRVWNAQTGEELRVFRTPVSVNSVAFSPDGHRIASGGDFDELNALKVWDAESGEEVLDLEDPARSIKSLAFSPDGRRIVCGNGNLQVFDVKSGKKELILRANDINVRSVAFSPDGQRIMLGGERDMFEGVLKVWDAQTAKELLTLNSKNGPVGAVAFNSDNQRIVCGSGRHIEVRDVQSGKEVLTTKLHIVRSIAFSPDGQRIVCGGTDKILKVLDAVSGREILNLRGHDDSITSVAFSPDGQRIVSGSQDKTIKIWDAQSGKEVLTLPGHKDSVRSVAFAPNDRRIISASDDTSIKMWDGQSGREMASFGGHTDKVWSAVLSPDGQRIVSGSHDMTVKVWDAQSGKELMTLRGHEGAIYAVALSSDGQRIASGSEDGTVKVWDVQKRTALLTLRGDDGPVGAVAFSPDNQRIVLGGGSWSMTKPKIWLWDAQTGKNLLSLQGHEGAIYSLRFSPDGQRIVSAGVGYEPIKIWDANPVAPSLVPDNNRRASTQASVD